MKWLITVIIGNIRTERNISKAKTQKNRDMQTGRIKIARDRLKSIQTHIPMRTVPNYMETKDPVTPIGMVVEKCHFLIGINSEHTVHLTHKIWPITATHCTELEIGESNVKIPSIHKLTFVESPSF